MIMPFVLAVFFAAAGSAHFLRPETYLAIMPPYIPAPLFMVYLSGALEIILGLLVLPRRTRRFAGAGLILLLLAVFPANLHMALNPQLFPQLPSWLLWSRLPFQGVFMFWVWKTCF